MAEGWPGAGGDPNLRTDLRLRNANAGLRAGDARQPSHRSRCALRKVPRQAWGRLAAESAPYETSRQSRAPPSSPKISVLDGWRPCQPARRLYGCSKTSIVATFCLAETLRGGSCFASYATADTTRWTGSSRSPRACTTRFGSARSQEREWAHEA